MSVKIARKPNGEVLGAAIFLDGDLIKPFLKDNTVYLEIKKFVTNSGILLEFQEIGEPQSERFGSQAHRIVKLQVQGAI